MTDVKLLALWTGWCDPCGEERPLALTEHGRRGLRAWLGGVGSENRRLLLACELCGIGQVVPQREQDDPEMPAPAPTEAVTLVRSTVRAADPQAAPAPVSSTPSAPQAAPPAATTPSTTTTAPTPRTADLDQTVVPTPRTADLDQTLDLLAEGLDVITVGAR